MRDRKRQMTYQHFQARAELYLGSDQPTAFAQGARAFRTVAQAIRFAIEEAAPISLHGARLQVGDEVFSGDEITQLYRRPDYPLPRKVHSTRFTHPIWGASRNQEKQR
jgi:hypothetical protein